MKKKILTLLIITFQVIFFSCKKIYEPPEIQAETNFLVVDGTINCGQGAITSITLSRSKRLNDSTLFDPELSAQVSIEEEQGSIFFVPEQGNGLYLTPPLNLDPSKKYRLKIITASNQRYTSSFVPAKVAPSIDSLTWNQDDDVIISVHTHDPTNATRYYRWDYIETWNYQSFYSTMYGVRNGLIYIKNPDEQTDSCWRTQGSNNILVNSTIALSEDVISNYPVAVVLQNSEKISKGYSILVRQYAITQDAFLYLQLIQKNTQQLGTLFDAQPSQLKGNIISEQNPEEPVIGYISASTVTEKRIFIRNSEVSNWNFIPPLLDCLNTYVIPQNPINYLIFDHSDPTYGPYYFITGGGLAIAKKQCLECTERGGTNVKPSFW